MILMSKYKGQQSGEKRVTNSGKDLPPSFSGNARKKLIFLLGGVPLSRTFSSLDDDLDLECRSGGLERKCWVARRAPTPSWVSPRLSGLSITMIIITFLSKSPEWPCAAPFVRYPSLQPMTLVEKL